MSDQLITLERERDEARRLAEHWLSVACSPFNTATALPWVETQSGGWANSPIHKQIADAGLDPMPRSDGSMIRCYFSFLEYYPCKKSEFPTYDLWICSDADDARVFRQGWAARCRTLEFQPNAKDDDGERSGDRRLSTCSDLIEVKMRGGTIVRIPAGRGDRMPYDLLLAALKVCQHWADDEEEWRDGDPFVYLEVIYGQND